MKLGSDGPAEGFCRPVRRFPLTHGNGIQNASERKEETDVRIIVCVKQVPGTNKVEVDPETGVLKRDGVASKLNPYDLFALETAFSLAAQTGATVSTITMGPPQAETVLREAMAMGADAAVLVTDRAFGGADTIATSTTLAAAIRTLDFDLIIGMDEENRRDLLRLTHGDPEGKVHLLMEIAGENRDVDDPWYSGDFDTAYRDILKGCKALLQKISPA